MKNKINQRITKEKAQTAICAWLRVPHYLIITIIPYFIENFKIMIQTNSNSIHILKQKIADSRQRLKELWNTHGSIDMDVLAASAELDALINLYQLLKLPRIKSEEASPLSNDTKELLKSYVHNLKQFQTAMEKLGLLEPAAAATESIRVTEEFLLYLEKDS